MLDDAYAVSGTRQYVQMTIDTDTTAPDSAVVCFIFYP